METLYDMLARTIASLLETAPTRIRPDSSFQDLGFDSLIVVELAERLEDDLKVPVSDGEIAQLERVSELVGLLQARGVRV